jgi:ribosomal protein S3AE
MAIAKRKKRFYDIEIPLIGKETQLRDFEKESLNGKFITYDLTRHLRGKNSILVLKVKASKEKIIAEPRSITLLPSFLRRMVRKGTNYVEDSFFAEAKDAKVRIKPFLITRRKVSRAIRKNLRDVTKEELVNYIKKKKIDDLFDDILKNQLQKTLSLKLKKIYPLSLCEIRVLKVVGDIKEIEEKEDVKEKKTKKEKSKEEKIEEEII